MTYFYRVRGHDPLGPPLPGSATEVWAIPSDGTRISQEGRQPPRWAHQPIILQNFDRKLHENERIWTEGGPVSLPGTHLDPPLTSLPSSPPPRPPPQPLGWASLPVWEILDSPLVVNRVDCQKNTVADPGFPPRWRRQLSRGEEGANIRFCQIFPNCMKLKEFGPP